METRSFITVKLTVEGLHNYPTAVKDWGHQVEYLQNMHRHNFIIRCTFLVKHDNRDKEFFLVKNQIKLFLHENYYDNVYQCCNFESLSCEQLAKQILTKFNCESVEVSEDDEDSATVVNTEEYNDEDENSNFFESNKKKIKLTFCVGYSFSGKTFLTQKNGMKKSVEMIEIGSIVREILGKEKREKCENLDKEIYEKIVEKIDKSDKNEFFIVGVRQKSVIDSLLKKYDDVIDSLFFIIVHADRESRKFRFEQNQNNPKNQDRSFEDIEQIDVQLGLNDLIIWIVENWDYVIIKND